MNANMIWRASKVIEGYEVNSNGEVRNAKTQKVINQVDHKNCNGEKTAHVRISHLGSRIFVEVATLVAETFPALVEAPVAVSKPQAVSPCMDGIQKIAKHNIQSAFAADGYKVSALKKIKVNQAAQSTENIVDETVRKSRGPKDISVMCKETGTIYPSKSAAAKANHMDGESVTDSIKYGRPRKGCTFVIVGDNA